MKRIYGVIILLIIFTIPVFAGVTFSQSQGSVILDMKLLDVNSAKAGITQQDRVSMIDNVTPVSSIPLKVGSDFKAVPDDTYYLYYQIYSSTSYDVKVMADTPLKSGSNQIRWMATIGPAVVGNLDSYTEGYKTSVLVYSYVKDTGGMAAAIPIKIETEVIGNKPMEEYSALLYIVLESKGDTGV